MPKYNYLTVVLEEDLNDETVTSLVDAIKNFRNVLNVVANEVGSAEYVSDMRARTEIGNKLFDIIYPKSKK